MSFYTCDCGMINGVTGYCDCLKKKRVNMGEQGYVVVTKNEDGIIVAVTRQDDEGRILSVISESEGIDTFYSMAQDEGYIKGLADGYDEGYLTCQELRECE